MTLRLSPDDLSLERSPESGVARQIANIPKDRARADRIKWYSMIEAEYVWPRYAASMIWLGKLGEAARGLHMQTSFRPAALPSSQAERIEVERHDLAIGITTPAKILADRLKVSEADARDALRSMREAEAEDRAESGDQANVIPLEVGKVTALGELVKSVGMGEIPVDSAKEMLRVVFGISPEDAALILDPVTAAEPAPATTAGPATPAPAPVQDKDIARKALLAKLATAKPGSKAPAAGEPDVAE
jgi:hypothetical protein